MKTLKEFLNEALVGKLTTISNKDIKRNKKYKCHPKTDAALGAIVRGRLSNPRFIKNGILMLNDIDVSNIKDFDSNVLSTNNILRNFDVRDWDMSNAITMKRTLVSTHCTNNTGIEDWDVSNCMSFNSCFYNSQINPDENDLSRWEIHDNAVVTDMFKNSSYEKIYGETPIVKNNRLVRIDHK